MLTVALLVTSLSQPAWLSLNGQSSPSIKPSEHCPRHLTLYQFFDFGFFEAENVSNPTFHNAKVIYRSSTGSIGCLTPFIVNIFKIVLMLNLMAVVISLIGFLLDIIGTSSKTFYIIRTNGLLSIVTVLICSGIVGLTYYTTVLIEKENRLSYAEVTYEYDYGFFILSAAGVTALLATACCLFKKGGNHSRRRTRSQHHRSRSRSRDAHLMLVDNMESPPFTDLTEPPPPYTP